LLFLVQTFVVFFFSEYEGLPPSNVCDSFVSKSVINALMNKDILVLSELEEEEVFPDGYGGGRLIME